ncbi:MAG: hydrolase [Nevskia sp.]|jgi:glutamate carboxypeptidase|nr:hydrolase [Nevskia sp.]MCK9385022.1 hydrolase [Nevskia sp.]
MTSNSSPAFNPTADVLSSIDVQASILRNELVSLSDINSGSFNAAGVDATADRLARLFASLAPSSSERIEVAPFRSTDDRGEWQEKPLGRALRLRKRPDAPLKIFFCGHLDTVFSISHSFQKARQLDADTLNGPGVADLKGGLLVMYAALTALEQSPYAERIGWEILFNPDEEIGSRSSAPLLAEAAARNHFGLIYEPAYADGGLASERKGSGNFDIIVRGRAAHAGRNPEDGRNAVALASELAVALHGLNGQREGLTVNVGYVHGGGALNIVPDRCVVKFNVRTSQASDEWWLQETLDQLLIRANTRYAAQGGFELELRGAITRPPKPVSAGTARLQALLGDCGRKIGLDLAFRPTGGCCDGNNLAAHGLANVDNLGVVGGDIHSDREWMRISSLAERSKLSALLLLRLASGELSWQ